jgi:hypothetical protein
MTDQPDRDRGVFRTVATGCDLRRFVLALIEEQQGVYQHDLATYLRSLLGVVRTWHVNSLAPPSYADLAYFLAQGFVAPPVDYDPAWEDVNPWVPSDPDPEAATRERRSFGQLERLVQSQIVDLRQMEAAGLLADPVRVYFGVDAPRGARWYNAVVWSYLERGTCWLEEAEEEAEREDGWADFASILHQGQIYE